MIDVLLLGTGGGMPVPNRFLSSILLNYKGRKILVDCGEGTQVSMRICNTGFKSIDVICITHTHGDHIVGLPGLLGTIGNSGRVEPVTIIGPEGITRAVEGLMRIVEYLPYEVNIVENPDGKFIVNNNYIKGELEISTTTLEHSSPCVGYSFYLRRRPKFDVEGAKRNDVPKVLWSKLQKEDKAITYEGKTYTKDMVLGEEREGIKISCLGDTRPIDSICDFVRYSDLFICEGNYGDDNDIEKAIKNKHMTFREAGILARKSDVKKLMLTHYSTAMEDPDVFIDNVKEEFDNVILGKDHLKINMEFD